VLQEPAGRLAESGLGRHLRRGFPRQPVEPVQNMWDFDCASTANQTGSIKEPRKFVAERVGLLRAVTRFE
jgi:hypothetical protein